MQGLSEDIVCGLASKAHRRFFVPRDVLLKDARVNDAMYVILFGYVAITSSRHNARFLVLP